MTKGLRKRGLVIVLPPLLAVAAVAAVATLLPAAFSAPLLVADHPCAVDEGKGTCAIGRVRMCAKDGALASCVCPPGATASPSGGASGSASGSACAIDAKAAMPPTCVVANGALPKTLSASLDFGELAVPSLRIIAPAAAIETVSTLDSKVATLSFVELSKLASAHEALEGSAGYEISQLPAMSPKLKLVESKRDAANDRAIAVRQQLLAKFATHALADEQRVAHARALLRRAAYKHVPGSPDRALAKTTLTTVVGPTASAGTATRDAAFILAEEAVRDSAWSEVSSLENQVLKFAAGRLDLDDVAYMAAANARLAHTRLSLGDLAGAKLSLIDAVTLGFSCAPRAECVSAGAGARNVLAAAWAASGSPARTLAPILEKGTMPKVQRVRPMLQLAEIYGAASGAACAQNADEARAWSQVVK